VLREGGKREREHSSEYFEREKLPKNPNIQDHNIPSALNARTIRASAKSGSSNVNFPTLLGSSEGICRMTSDQTDLLCWVIVGTAANSPPNNFAPGNEQYGDESSGRVENEERRMEMSDIEPLMVLFLLLSFSLLLLLLADGDWRTSFSAIFLSRQKSEAG
jgi:hypothetical protein